MKCPNQHCKRTLKSKADLDRHLPLCKPRHSLKCESCGRLFKKRALVTRDGVVARPVRCPKCGSARTSYIRQPFIYVEMLTKKVVVKHGKRKSIG